MTDLTTGTYSLRHLLVMAVVAGMVGASAVAFFSEPRSRVFRPVSESDVAAAIRGAIESASTVPSGSVLLTVRNSCSALGQGWREFEPGTARLVAGAGNRPGAPAQLFPRDVGSIQLARSDSGAQTDSLPWVALTMCLKE
jgi:hypothetical protein